MNGNQLRALWLGVVAEVAAFLFPPFRDVGSTSGELGGSWNRFGGYHFIALGRYGHPDLPLLTIEMLLIAAVAGAAVVTLRPRPFDPMAHLHHGNR